jgi:hypothetical protein
MIEIKVFKNGYEIKGHAEPNICSEVSFWHWTASNLIQGLDRNAKEYASARDNKQNPQEGYSWLVYDNSISNLAWIVEDFVVSAEAWGRDYWKGQVRVIRVDGTFAMPVSPDT